MMRGHRRNQSLTFGGGGISKISAFCGTDNPPEAMIEKLGITQFLNGSVTPINHLRGLPVQAVSNSAISSTLAFTPKMNQFVRAILRSRCGSPRRAIRSASLNGFSLFTL